MSQLPPDKLAEVAAILEKTSPEMAARLVTMFERVKVKGVEAIPSDALISAVRESGVSLPDQMARLPGFDRLFFEPFEELFESPQETAPPLPGHLSRAGLKQLWQYLCQLVAPSAHDRLDPMIRAAVLRGAHDRARALAAEFRDVVADELARPDVHKRWLADMVAAPGAPGPGSAARRLPALLMAEKAARPLLAQSRSNPRDMPDSLSKSLASTLRTLEASSPEAALELVLLVISHTPKPWQALRIFAAASTGVNDRKLALTEFNLVGQRLLAMAARDVALFAQAASGQPFGSQALVAGVERFGNLVAGLLREDVLSQGGPWRQGLQKLQAEAASRLETVCQRALELTSQALPVDRVRVKSAGLIDRPRTQAELRMDRVDRLPPHYSFLRDVRLFAGAAGFAGARERATRGIDHHLSTVREGLLAMRDPANRGACHEQWTRALALLMEAYESEEAARTFERRMAA